MSKAKTTPKPSAPDVGSKNVTIKPSNEPFNSPARERLSQYSNKVWTVTPTNPGPDLKK